MFTCALRFRLSGASCAACRATTIRLTAWLNVNTNCRMGSGTVEVKIVQIRFRLEDVVGIGLGKTYETTKQKRNNSAALHDGRY